nr:hypothetical protein CFP56_24190 [Quercus suber]
MVLKVLANKSKLLVSKIGSSKGNNANLEAKSSNTSKIVAVSNAQSNSTRVRVGKLAQTLSIKCYKCGKVGHSSRVSNGFGKMPCQRGFGGRSGGDCSRNRRTNVVPRGWR